MDFNEVILLLQTGKYEEEHKRVAVLTWVAEKLEIRLKSWQTILR